MTSTNSSSSVTLMGSTSTQFLSDGDENTQSTTALATDYSGSTTTTTTVSPSVSSLNGDLDSTSSEISNSTTLASTPLSSSTTILQPHVHSNTSSVTSLEVSYSSNSSYADSSSSFSFESSLSSETSSKSNSDSSYSSSSRYHQHSSESSNDSSSTTPSSRSSDLASSTLTSSAVSSSAESPESSSYGYAEATEDPSSTTLTYEQPYYITDSSTTVVTELPVTTVVGVDDVSVSSSQATITTDMAFLANAVPGYTSTSGSSSSSSSSPSSSSSSSGSSDDSVGTGTVAGSVVGSVCGAAIVVFLIWLWLRRRKRQSRSFEKGFSHSIASTRRYDSTDRGFNEKESKSLSKDFSLKSLWPSTLFRSDTSSSHSLESAHSGGFGLGSLRSSILQDQEQIASSDTGYVPPHDTSVYTRQPRTIDTVLEEPETSSTQSSPVAYTNTRHTSYKTSRYQNAGLRGVNPFDDTAAVRRVPPSPPVPPIPRRTNNNGPDFHRHGTNRHSVASVESSIISDDTDEVSSDESLILNESDQRNTGSGGFFREIV